MSETTAVAQEDTPLVQGSSENASSRFGPSCRMGWLIVIGVFVVISGAAFAYSKKIRNTGSTPLSSPFPEDFVWGAATSSYQIEGGIKEGGRGVSIWDTFCKQPGNIADGSNGDVACDHYHLFREDVQLMKALGIQAYRFSIAWPRIFPNGTGDVNPEGIDFYNQLIDELLNASIEPWITLYHWDLPQALEDEYAGWLGPTIVDDFGEYARVCFDAFGDRVKHWITINEAWTVAVQAYQDGTKAPGRTVNPPVEVYQAGHNLLLAHARATSIYKRDFAPIQQGVIGISNSGDFRYPLDSDSSEDQQAAERAMAFQYAWFVDPIVYGDYPREMRERVGDRLPRFSDEQRKDLIGSIDFMGLNHYSTLYASIPSTKSQYGGYWTDMDVHTSSDDAWHKNYMDWSTNPDGCRELLLWITKRYPNVPIVITENGTSEYEPDLETAVRDENRRHYFETYIRACGQAIALGVPLVGYFAWSLLDNFEWEHGYTKRFGLCFVDFETLERTPKSSARWYRDLIDSKGEIV